MLLPHTLPPARTRIRDADPADHAAIIAINNATGSAMSAFDAEAIATLVRHAAYARVAEDSEGVAAFLLGLAPGAPYSSPNYRWFEARYDAFLYIDRIAVADRARRAGVGSALYADIAQFAAGRWPCLLAEVNRDPPNPISDTFHARHGFVEVGDLRHTYPGAHAAHVTMLRREISAPQHR